MEFGREAVAEHLVKNNMPRFKDWELDLSGAIDGMMDFNAELDKISKDIQKRKDNAMAMAFTKDIGDLLKKNGVCPKFEEYSDRVMGETKIEMRYGVGLVDLDFSEHDKPFEDEIAKLETLLQKQDEFLDMKNLQIDELKQRIAELEQSRSEWIDRAVEWQQKCEKLESEKSEKPVAYVLAKEIDGQHYVTVEDFMSVVNNLQ